MYTPGIHLVARGIVKEFFSPFFLQLNLAKPRSEIATKDQVGCEGWLAPVSLAAVQSFVKLSLSRTLCCVHFLNIKRSCFSFCFSPSFQMLRPTYPLFVHSSRPDTLRIFAMAGKCSPFSHVLRYSDCSNTLLTRATRPSRTRQEQQQHM